MSEVQAPARTVYVIDDDPSVRKGLDRLLRSAGHRAECFCSAQEFLEAHDRGSVSCLILDVRLPGLDGLELQRELAEREITTPIVFITGHGDVPMSVQAMKAGALDFLTKPFHDQDLLDAVERGLAEDVKTRRARAIVAEITRRLDLLTARERDVFNLVITGLLNKQIGAELGIVEKTVKVHRARVMEKMEVKSVAELVHLAELVRTHGR